MPLPHAVAPAARILGELVLDCVLGRPPSVDAVAERLDRAVDWRGLPEPVRSIVEALDRRLMAVVVELVIDGVEWIRPDLVKAAAQAHREAGPRA
jgi:hypothetical protein